MSGLFRYNSNVTPNRRSTQNPFCSITQDGTMDSSFGFGFRSPSCSNLHTGGNGALSPTHGLSLREFDEKLKALQKENFNLKFRVYFLETSLGGNQVSNGPNKTALDDDSLLKQNIDLKVEVEGLRKELEEKQELLVQAAKAMELMETSQRKQQETSTSTKNDLEQKVHELEKEIRTWNSTHPVTTNNSLDNIEKITQIENELKAQIESMANIIKTNEEQIKDLTNNLNDAQQQLKTSADVIKARDEQIKELKFRLANNMSRDSVESFMSESDNIEELKEQMLLQRQKIADKLCVIQELEEKLASKTRAHDKGCQTIQLLLIKTRELDAKIEELQSKKPSNQSVDAKEVESLRVELQEARNDAEQAHRWRTECAEVCSILTARLNELAGFLDSLLKHKDVLSVLAQDRHRAMRKAVDNSLDLSRSLSITSAGRMSLNDTSLLQMSSISDILKDSFFAGRFSFDETDTRNTLVIENLRSEVESLKSELNRIKSESNANGNANGIDGRRLVARVSQTNEMHSDSEEWSEPDRQVSHERIGLDESIKMNAHVRSPAGKYKTVAVSSSATDDTNDTRTMRKNSILRFQEKILELESQIMSKNSEIDAIQSVNNDLQMEIDRLNDDIETLKCDHRNEIANILEREADKLKSTVEQLTTKLQKDLDEKIAAQKEQIAQNYVLRSDFECVTHEKCELEDRLSDTETLLQLMRDNEDETKRQITEKEQCIRDLKRIADEATLQISKVVLERTKFMNERDHFETLCNEFKEKSDALAIETSELHSKLAKLSHDNAQLHNKLVLNETQFQLTRSASQGNARYVLSSPKSSSMHSGGYNINNNNNASSSGDQSGYTSDETRQRLENSSPDLGIDSDGTCRSSGTDGNASRSFNTTKANRSNKSELNDSFTNILLECEEEPENSELPRSPGNLSILTPVVIHHDCEKIDKENAELRRKLERTRRAFEKTWAQLRISNQRKEQIEKDIRQEIYKTHSVLKNVRSNIDRAAASPLSKSASATIRRE